MFSWLPSPLQILPQPATAVGLGVVLNLFFRRYPDLKERLRELSGKIFRFEVEDLDQEFYMEVQADGGVLIHTYCDEDWHVAMSGSSGAFLSLMFNLSDPDSLFFSRELKMSGETDAGLHFKNILNNVEIDWEKELSLILGRPLARVVGDLGQRARQAGESGRRRLEEETERWMGEKGFPRPGDLEALQEETETLDKAAEALERRLTRLVNKRAIQNAEKQAGKHPGPGG